MNQKLFDELVEPFFEKVIHPDNPQRIKYEKRRRGKKAVSYMRTDEGLIITSIPEIVKTENTP